MGKKAGTTSDLITNSEENTGANIGEGVGTIAGVVIGVKALFDENRREEQQMRQCLHNHDYKVAKTG
jgi:transcriptional/translational regulatory protein YebC/TACO1